MSTPIPEHSVVETAVELRYAIGAGPAQVVPVGIMGTVVHVHRDGVAYEVEFPVLGEVITLRRDQLTLKATPGIIAALDWIRRKRALYPETRYAHALDGAIVAFSSDRRNARPSWIVHSIRTAIPGLWLAPPGHEVPELHGKPVVNDTDWIEVPL